MIEKIDSPTIKEIGWFKKFQKSFWGELLQIAVISLIIIIPFRMYIAQPFLVSGSSMDDTFADGQYLIVDELTYNFRPPARGEVIIFHYPLDTKKFFIKRIIGLPGETVEIKKEQITICRPNCQTDKNKFTLIEPYAKLGSINAIRPDSSTTLKDNEYFVLGDNRMASSDSRIWGPVKLNQISGRPILRLLPLSQFNLWPGQINEK